MTDDTRDVLEMVIAENRHAPTPGVVRGLIAALAAQGLVIADKDDVLWLRALRAAGVDNWQGIEHAIDLRADMEADTQADAADELMALVGAAEALREDGEDR